MNVAIMTPMKHAKRLSTVNGGVETRMRKMDRVHVLLKEA